MKNLIIITLLVSMVVLGGCAANSGTTKTGVKQVTDNTQKDVVPDTTTKTTDSSTSSSVIEKTNSGTEKTNSGAVEVISDDELDKLNTDIENDEDTSDLDLEDDLDLNLNLE